MKNIITTLIIAGCISIILYFFLRGEKSKDLVENQQNPISVVNIDNNIIKNNKPKDINTKLTLDKVLESNNNNIPIEFINIYVGNCGTNFDDHYSKKEFFSKVISIKKDTKSKSKKQLEAKNIINSECELWHNYISELSNDEISNIKHNSEEAKKARDYYYQSGDKQLLNEAKESINSGENYKQKELMALYYLLQNDDNLIPAIAENLGTKDFNYIKNNNFNTITLYECEINPQACVPNSFQNLNSCFDNEEYCGMSSQQYLASVISPNQYSDLINIIEIIKMLIRQGYFE